MALFMEGFERFALGQVASARATPNYYDFDPLGASFFTYINGTSKIEICDSSTDFMISEGKAAMFYSSTGQPNGDDFAMMNLRFPSSSVTTKIVVGFSIYVSASDVTDATSEYSMFEFRTYDNAKLTLASLSIRKPQPENVQVQIAFGSTPGVWTPLSLETWNYIEIVSDKDNSTIELYVNDVLKDTLSVSISGAAITAAESLLFKPIYPYYINGFPSLYIDHIYVLNNSDGAAVDRVGPCRIYMPILNGTLHADFAPNTTVDGNYESVGDIPINTNTYVTASAEGAKDIHAATNPIVALEDGETILAVQSKTLAQTTVGTQTLTTGVGVGGTFVDSVATAVGSEDVSKIICTAFNNPITGDKFTTGGLDNIETGYVIGNSM